MSILRVFKLNNNINIRNSYIMYKNFATENTKSIENISKTKTTASANIEISAIEHKEPEIMTENEIFVKPEAILPPPSLKDPLSGYVPFDEVPGPKLLQHIAKAWNFIPVFGNQVTTTTVQYMLSANHLLGSQLSWGRNTFLFSWMMDEYGPVVRLQCPFGGNIVVLSRPEDALSVFANEGRYPIRSNLDCLEKYRMEYRKFKHPGPFIMYGEDWEKLRKQVTNTLSKSTPYQFQNIDIASNKFITRINSIKNKQDEVPTTFWQELCKWSLECLCSVLLGPKLSFVTMKTNLECVRLLEAYHGATSAIRRCETGLHLWKFLETPAWKSLVKNCDAIDMVFGKYLQEAEENLRNKKQETIEKISYNNVPLIQAMILQDEILPEDILTVFLDMLLIGVHATTHSMAFLIYHLARCPRAQRILSDEVKIIPDNFSFEDLSKLTYLKACIKESLRLKPPIPLLSRVLTQDTVVSNYRIPKGTVMLMATYLSSIKEEHFDDALKFVPERWLNSDLSSTFACIPFGYGPKACMAKSLAEMQLSILLIKMLRNYKINYHYGDINSSNRMLACPDKPLKFRFENRSF